MFGDIALIVVLSLCVLIVAGVLHWTLHGPSEPYRGLPVDSELSYPSLNVKVLDPSSESFAEILARARRDLYDQEGELTSPSDAMNWIKDLRGRLAEGDR